ncbi:MAG: TonB-dependent receptor plug domain-containing protein, partial [Paludibacteraceae bacterium]|nr:TonB-dependent receptor plug domain-containing protein [Paludibacteraceae bacterium]
MRKKSFVVAAMQLAVCASALAQVENDSVMQNVNLDEVTVISSRFGNEHSLSKSSLLSKDFQQQNMGENLPYLLQKTPSLVVTSDDGLGVGYTYFRVRGTDQSRINMTINGIPLNDSESQSVFWVNMTDMVGSMSKMDVQRGVGTSVNGAAAFGASVNMQTELVHQDPYAEIAFNGGSYNTFRESVKVGTGLLKHGFSVDARYSKVNSNGYVEYGNSDLHSYFVSGAWYGTKTMVKLLAFGGKEKTGIAWDGISPAMWRDNPRYNGAGEYVDENGTTQYYKNNTDNYFQQHYQAHVSHIFNQKWSLNAALHYTRGDGYTEQVKYAKLKDYLLSSYLDKNGD